VTPTVMRSHLASIEEHLNRARAVLVTETSLGRHTARHELDAAELHLKAIADAIDDDRLGCPLPDERCPWSEKGRNLCQQSAEEQAPRE
jgi:hypothetical protein